MSADHVRIRPMVSSDAAAVAALSGELGYPATADAVAIRLARIRRSMSAQPAEMLIAEDTGTAPSSAGSMFACRPIW